MKKYILSYTALIVMVIQFDCAKAQTGNRTTFGEMALQESVVPIHPGIPGIRPFWNAYALQFIYAPSFDIKPIPNATKYKFEILSAVDSKLYTFESDVPNAALSPIWASLPIGKFSLKVTAFAGDDRNLGIAGEGKYYRAAYFNGIYHQQEMGYDESAKIALDQLLSQPYVQYWLKNKKPDPSYGYYRYPAKIMGALIVGAVTQARLKANTPDAAKYTELAQIIADYMISISFAKDRPLAYFPPTYYGYSEVFKKSNKTIDTNNDLIISAAEAGNAYLDLYALNKEKKYLEAAKRIAQTYVKTQMDNGSWHLFVNVNTGKNTAPNIAIPTAIINYFDRLKREYQVGGLENAKAKAVAWIMDNPMKTFDWQGQFEDINAKPPYKNQSREQACDMAVYLLNNVEANPSDLKLAEELIRFAEDQFVIWEKPVPLEKEAKSRSGRPANWITPTVQEQFAYWMPVGRAAGIMMETYRKAYEVTKKEIYLAKAKSIANTFTLVQQANGGIYSTYFVANDDLGFWLNSAVYPAKMMMLLERSLHKK